MPNWQTCEMSIGSRARGAGIPIWATTPCVGQRTLVAAERITTTVAAKSNPRHSRTPWHWSYPGERRPHTPHRCAARFAGRARTTTTDRSNSTPKTTLFSEREADPIRCTRARRTCLPLGTSTRQPEP